MRYGRRGKGPNWHKRFKRCGYSWTVPRQVIMDVLTKSKEHLSAEDIYMEVRAMNANIGLTTIYRTLDILVDMGIVVRSDFGDGRARYELAAETEERHHHHLVCVECKSVIDYTDFISEEVDFLKKVEKGLSRKYDFDIREHTIQFYGVCKECKKA